MAELCAACSGIWPLLNPLAFVAYFVGKFSPVCRGNCGWVNFNLAIIYFWAWQVYMARFYWHGCDMYNSGWLDWYSGCASR